MSAVTVQHRVFPDVLTPAIMFQCQCCCLPSPSFNPHPAREPSATHRRCCRTPSCGCCFNPHPAREPSATWPTYSSSRFSGCFNPHPAREPSATSAGRGAGDAAAVSILTRPVSRVQRTARSMGSSSSTGFNPHPAREPSATPIPVFSTCSPRTSSIMAKCEHILFNLTAGFKHGRSMDANPQLGSAVAMGSRYAKRGPVKSTTLLWPYSSTRLSRPSGSL